MVLIKVLKFFFITIILSYLAVWISNRPGTVKIVWQEYLVETNVIGLLFVLIFSIFLFVVFFSLISKLKNFPKNFSNSKKDKLLFLGNESLDDIAINLFIGDSIALEKNSRKLKKYLGNQLFSTVMLFNTSLSNENYEDANKYLKILKSIPKAEYISNRAEVLILFKENKIDEALTLLSKLKKEFNDDLWISEKLAIIYSQKKEWELAWQTVEGVADKQNKSFSNLKANLHALSGNNILDSLKISNHSFFIINEAIKKHIKEGNLNKAIKLIEKNWLQLNCTDIIETFIKFELKNNSDSLKRHKLLTKAIKKFLHRSDETKLALAKSAYQAKIWGESQKYLDEIPEDNWDERIINLYKEISKKSEKITFRDNFKEVKPVPLWSCLVCKKKYKEWQFVCNECFSVNRIKWSKEEIIVKKNFFLENPFRHLPKMK